MTSCVQSCACYCKVSGGEKNEKKKNETYQTVKVIGGGGHQHPSQEMCDPTVQSCVYLSPVSCALSSTHLYNMRIHRYVFNHVRAYASVRCGKLNIEWGSWCIIMTAFT
ncbi:uncharacterized protein LOC112685089 [Sipha flava]|uniref:Uncharacterized protein LOC112685089 n=1 Tax=Sipha flava TaxID=143950 RepID=A0A8B8FPK9_9HEMI|nr:uncharacterized protein LOC112685089 [Sipha flava]